MLTRSIGPICVLIQCVYPMLYLLFNVFEYCKKNYINLTLHYIEQSNYLQCCANYSKQDCGFGFNRLTRGFFVCI